MNVYFLVEGRRCERKLYPLWLSFLTPHLQRVTSPSLATENSYFLISGEGYPSILDIHLPNAIRDIEKTKQFDFLVVVLDAEEDSVQERYQKVVLAADRSETKLQSARLEVVVQNRCIETWLLGNRKIVPRQPQDAELKQYIAHYDVRQNDPEQMTLHTNFLYHAHFHLDYLKRIFQERGVAYTKTHPGQAGDRSYVEQLTGRVAVFPDHIETFSHFLHLCSQFGSLPMETRFDS